MRYLNRIVVGCVLFFFIPIAALAGNLSDPGAPGSDASKMYTLENIYQRLSDNTQASDPQTESFTEPGSGPTEGTGHTLNDVYGKAIPTQVPKTGQTITYATGDDGALEKGVAWPSTRFTDNTGDEAGTVTDNLTGLMWAENANADGTKTWATALTYCNGLSLGGYTDWRLPNVKELVSLMDWGQSNPVLPDEHPFDNVQPDFYYSSTTVKASTTRAWRVYFASGDVSPGDNNTYYYVWPVRGGQ